MRSPRTPLLREQLKGEVKEWLYILLTLIILVLSLVIADNCQRIDNLQYLEARMADLEMQVRWKIANNPLRSQQEKKRR